MVQEVRVLLRPSLQVAPVTAQRKRRVRKLSLRAFINKAAKEVEAWPDWMKGKPDPVLRQTLKEQRE